MFKRFLLVVLIFAGRSVYAREPKEVREANTKALFNMVLSVETATSDVSRLPVDKSDFYKKRALRKIEESKHLLAEIDHKIAGNRAKEILQNLEAAASKLSSGTPSDKVVQALRNISKMIVEAYQVETAPALVPDLEHGRKIYVSTCASCHGATGEGQGPLVSDRMQPKPPNYLDARFMDNVSPFRIFHVLSIGMDTELMPSYEQMLNVEERWAVAFFVFQMRYPKGRLTEKQLAAIAADTGLDLKQIAWLTDNELRSRLASAPKGAFPLKSDPVGLVRTDVAFFKALARSSR
ncbi:MAG: c-type cytochrome [Oligoflexales bacterium]